MQNACMTCWSALQFEALWPAECADVHRVNARLAADRVLELTCVHIGPLGHFLPVSATCADALSATATSASPPQYNLPTGHRLQRRRESCAHSCSTFQLRTRRIQERRAAADADSDQSTLSRLFSLDTLSCARYADGDLPKL